MKKVSLAFAIVLAVPAIFLLGCGKESTKEPSNTMKVTDYDYLGKMHNDFMSNTLNNLDINVTDKNKDEVLSEITAFNVEYARKSYSKVLPENISCFNDFEELLDNSAFCQYILKKQTKGSESYVEEYFSNETGDLEDIPSLYSMMDYLHSCGTLQDKSYEMLVEITNILSLSIEGQISDANFCKKIDELVYEFDNHGFGNDDIDGAMVASVLSITSSSMEWWQNNPDASIADSKLPQVVGMDVAGVITGVVIDGIRQGICIGAGAQDGWDWASTGWAALGGAVDGSLGVSSKIFKVLSKIIK